MRQALQKLAPIEVGPTFGNYFENKGASVEDDIKLKKEILKTILQPEYVDKMKFSTESDDTTNGITDANINHMLKHLSNYVLDDIKPIDFKLDATGLYIEIKVPGPKRNNVSEPPPTSASSSTSAPARGLSPSATTRSASPSAGSASRTIRLSPTAGRRSPPPSLTRGLSPTAGPRSSPSLTTRSTSPSAGPRSPSPSPTARPRSPPPSPTVGFAPTTAASTRPAEASTRPAEALATPAEASATPAEASTTLRRARSVHWENQRPANPRTRLPLGNQIRGTILGID